MATALTLSSPLAADLVVYRGDTGHFRVTVTDPGGAPLDVTAGTWRCQVRPSADAGPPIPLTVVPAVDDVASVDVFLDAPTSESLRSGVWDLELTLEGEVMTLLSGAVKVTKDVSNDAALASTLRPGVVSAPVHPVRF